MPNVRFVASDGNETEINVPLGENVMRGALYNAVEGIVGECGGGLSCATCHVYVDEAWLGKVGGPASQAEVELLESTASEVRTSSRLGCQIELTGELDGLIVHLPPSQY